MLTLIYLEIVLIFILRHRREGKYKRIRSAKEHGTTGDTRARGGS